MGRSSSRNSARTCPRCAALLLTDATSCGICRFDLTAPPVVEPAPPVVEAVEAVDESIEAVAPPVTDTEELLDTAVSAVVETTDVETPVAETSVAETSVEQAPEARSDEARPEAPESPAAEAPVVEVPAVEAPAFASPVFESPAAADEPEAVVAEPVVVPAVTVDSTATDIPATEQMDEPTHAPTHALSNASVDTASEVPESHTLFSPTPFEAPDELASREHSADTAAMAVPPTDASAPTAEPYAFGAPAAHVARHGRPDARGVQAPNALSSSILILGILRVASLALSVVLAWWAVQQVTKVLNAVFTVDASGEPNLDGFGDLNSAIATAGFSALVGVISTLLSVAFLVCLMVWTSRARTVAAVSSPGEHRFSPTWAVIGWIVPLANFVVPFVVISDLYKSADPKSSQTRGRFSGSVPAEIILLWVTWVASVVLAIVQLTSRNTSIAAGVGVSPFSSLQWVWLLTTVISTGLMIAVVRRITAWQNVQLTDAVGHQLATTRAADPRFGGEWHDTVPVPLAPTYEPPLASSSPVGAGVNATQAYEPPPMSAAPATPLPSSSLDQARINPRDPFSFPPPGQQV